MLSQNPELDNFDHKIDYRNDEKSDYLGNLSGSLVKNSNENSNKNLSKSEKPNEKIGEKITLENYQESYQKNPIKIPKKSEILGKNSKNLDNLGFIKIENRKAKEEMKDSIDLVEIPVENSDKNPKSILKNDLEKNYSENNQNHKIGNSNYPKTDFSGSESDSKTNFSNSKNNSTINSKSDSKSVISVIIPCFNEEENIADCYNELKKVWQKLPLYDYEIIFVDDGSSDWTVMEITKIQIQDPRVRLVEFSRNFGKEIAISAGFDHCSGESAIVVDADLQYPLDKIPEFVALWENGSEVVIGMRDKKQTANIIEKIGSRCFYWIMGRIGEREILPGALDFRLIDREVIDHFNRFTERNRMTRALVDWLGFDRAFVSYQEKPRNKGTVSYSLTKRIKLALNSFILHSLFPLKFAGYLGIFITIFAGILGGSSLINQFLTKESWIFSGPFLLGLLNLFLIGILLVCLGLIALYIANIHTEVVNRPLYVVKTRRVKTQNRLQVIVDE